MNLCEGHALRYYFCGVGSKSEPSSSPQCSFIHSFCLFFALTSKNKPFVPFFSDEEEKKLHPSPLKIGDLVGTIIDEFCQVSIDTIQPDTRNLQTLFEGPMNEVPEKYLDKHFRPIEIIKDYEDEIHLIIN